MDCCELIAGWWEAGGGLVGGWWVADGARWRLLMGLLEAGLRLVGGWWEASGPVDGVSAQNNQP